MATPVYTTTERLEFLLKELGLDKEENGWQKLLEMFGKEKAKEEE